MRLAVTADQARVLQSKAPFTCLAAGRRWGKSITDGHWLAKGAWDNPGSTWWYTSLSYGRALKQKRVMESSKGFRRYIAHSYAQFPPRFILTNGSEIAFRSLDRPDNLLGDGLAGLVVDEAARVPYDVWKQTLLPMLADTKGRALLTSTYNGRDWFYEMTQRGLKGAPGIAAFEFPTSTGLKFQGAEGRERLARLRAEFDADTWAQEFECKPLAMSDAVFGRWVDRVVVASKQAARRNAPTCVSIDLGRVVDPTVMVTVQPLNRPDGSPGGVCPAAVWIVVDVQEFPLGMEHAEIAARCAEHVGKFAAPCVVLDSTGGASGGREESFVRYYRERLPGLRAITWNATTKSQMVGSAKLLIEQKRTLIPGAFARTIDQLKVYRYKRKEMSNWVIYGAPDGQHDDHVAAFIQAAYAIEQDWIAAVGAGLPLSSVL